MMLAVGIIKLRHDYGEPEEGEFRTPFVPFLPIVSLLISFGLLLNYDWITWFVLIILLLLATLFYFGYSYRHSHLRNED